MQPCMGEELLLGQLCCGRLKTGKSVVCRGAFLVGSLCEFRRWLTEEKGRLWATAWFLEGGIRSLVCGG